MAKYRYEIVGINSQLLDKLSLDLESNNTLIEGSVREPQKAIVNTGWVNSFESLINFIDPYGTSDSGSLKQQWTDSFLINGEHSSADYQKPLIFSQKVGVLRSLLFGKVKVTIQENELTISKCIFHKRSLPAQNNFVFVVMPFTTEWSNNLWLNILKPTIQNINSLPLICKRADDLYGIDVMQDIYESILTCRIVIAEVTGRNANVFYELGIAHSLGKDVILLSQGEEHIPFDLNRFRHCIYENNEQGLLKMKKYLEDAIIDTVIKSQTSR